MSDSSRKSFEDIVEQFKDGNHSDKLEALEEMSSYPFDEVRQYIFEGLKDNNHRVRSTAGKLLGKKGDETVLSPLLHLLFDDSWIIRASAQEALSHLPENLAIPAFRGILANPEGDPNLRKNIAGVLAKYENPEATEILIQMFKNSREEQLRAIIADYLGKRHDEKATKALFEALGDESWSVRNSASKALKQMDIQAVMDRALRDLANPNRFIHMAVIELLTGFANEEVLDSLADVLVEGNSLARYNTLSILTGINTDESLSIMLKSLSDQHVSMRNRAIEVLAASKDESIFKLLKRCTKSKNWSLKQGAIQAVGLSGTDSAIDLLEDMMSDENATVRLMILEVLAKNSNRRSLQIITRHLDRPDLGEGILNIIRSLDQDIAIKHLVSFLTDKQFFSRSIKALAEMDELKVFRVLSSRLATGSPQQQIRSVEAMGILGGNHTGEFLKKFETSNLSPSLRTAIQTAIRRIRKRKA